MDFHSVVLLSGRGSNFGAIARVCGKQLISHVFSDKETAPGLKLAADLGLPVTAFSGKGAVKAIFSAIDELRPNLVILAGFMRIIPSELITPYEGRVINIHPSLLPKYRGLNTHVRALESGDTEAGCTVHYVDSGVDTGPIIAQARVPIVKDDTIESLQARVLEAEHQIYPWVISKIAEGLISYRSGSVVIEPSLQGEIPTSWTLSQ